MDGRTRCEDGLGRWRSMMWLGRWRWRGRLGGGETGIVRRGLS